jgi:TetR/AcrR family transcriptional repressor of nem operon
MQCSEVMSPMVVERNPDQTRKTLLMAAFQEIHRNGFKRASLDSILENTGLTKGALYHHFPNKQALGYAVVDEVLRRIAYEIWVKPMVGSDDPISALQAILSAVAAHPQEDLIKHGCPLNNLSQEMSGLDEGFRTRLDTVFSGWRDGIAACLEHGKTKGAVRADVDSPQAGTFIIASLEGCIGMAKNARSVEVLRQCGQGLSQYLETLRPPQ